MDERAQVLADKAEIVELMTRYCFAVDFRDFDALRAVFAPDAEATYVLSPLGLGLEDVHLSGAGETGTTSEVGNPESGRLGGGRCPRIGVVGHRGRRGPKRHHPPQLRLAHGGVCRVGDRLSAGDRPGRAMGRLGRAPRLPSCDGGAGQR